MLADHKYIPKLRFADDTSIIGINLQEVRMMLHELATETAHPGQCIARRGPLREATAGGRRRHEGGNGKGGDGTRDATAGMVTGAAVFEP